MCVYARRPHVTAKQVLSISANIISNETDFKGTAKPQGTRETDVGLGVLVHVPACYFVANTARWVSLSFGRVIRS